MNFYFRPMDMSQKGKGQEKVPCQIGESGRIFFFRRNEYLSHSIGVIKPNEKCIMYFVRMNV